MAKRKVNKGEKITGDCINAARELLNLFTEEELETYIKQVSSETQKLQENGAPFPRDAAVKHINKAHLESMLHDSARSARDISKWDINKSKLDAGVRPKSFLDKTAQNTDHNIETASNASKQQLHNEAFGRLTREDLEILEEGRADDSIFAVADGAEHGDPLIRKLGEALRNYIDPRNAKLIKSDAMRPSEMSKDRYFRNTYNPSKMLKLGKENWVSMHKSFLDIKGTFENTRAMNLNGEIDEAIVDEMIGNTFDNIIEGNGVLFTRASVSRDADAIERARHIFYKYKDWKSWGLANKQYGQGSLMKSWEMDINSTGQQIGMAEIMGTQPQKMWLEMRHVQVKKEVPNSVNKLEYQQADALFNNLLGVNRGAYDPTLANVAASLRAVSSISRLGKIVFRSIPDISNISGIAQRAGMSYWKTYYDSIINAFNLMPDDARRMLAKDMAHSLKVHSGTASRYMDTVGMGETVNKMSNKFFHGLGLNAWDIGNKLSAMTPIMKGYGRQSKKTFNALNNQQQSYLRRFNISDKEWDVIRSKTEKNLFSVSNVDKMTDNEIRELWNQGDKLTPLSDYRSSLYRKVFSMFDTAHEFAVLNPTAYTNMITTWNTRAGTLGGEAVRMIMQFKGYPVNYMRRVWVGGMQDFDGYQARMMYGLNMALGTMMLAGLSETLVAIASGLTPPNPANMSRGEQLKYYGKLLAGGLGVFGTILNDRASVKSMLGTFATPSLRLIGDPLVAGVSLATGNLKNAKSVVKDWVNVANPIGTLPLISPYVDSFLGNKPYIEPGQTPLY